MAVQLYSNNATGFLASGIALGATSLTLGTGQGAGFPSPTNGDWFLLTLVGVTAGAETSWEILKCTARTSDTLTVVRAQEGTTAAAWSTGTKAELRVTAATLTTLNGTTGVNTGDETVARIGVLLNSATAKTTLIDSDTFGIIDNGVGGVLKQITWANTKAVLVATALTWSATQSFAAINTGVLSATDTVYVRYSPSPTTYYGQLGNYNGNFDIRANGDSAGIIFGTTAVGGTTATEQMRLTNRGNLGLGTDSPGICTAGVTSKILTVLSGSGRAILELASTVADGADTLLGDIEFLGTAQTLSTYKRVAAIRGYTSGTTATNRGGYLIFTTRADGGGDIIERMRIYSTGGVSINNTTDPGAGNLSVTGTGTFSDVLKSTSTYGWAIGSVAGVARLQHDAGEFSFLNTGNQYANIRLAALSATTGTFSGSVLLNNSQYLQGKDIIGTARNLLGFYSSNIVEINRDGNHDTAINPNGGRVGIGTGTTAPGTTLVLQSSTQAAISFNSSAGTTLNYIGQSYGVNQALPGSASGDLFLRTESKKIMFGTRSSSATDMTITNGYVGVGTTAPNYLLDTQTTGTTLTHNLKVDAAPAAGNYGEIAFQTWTGAASGLNTFGGTGTSRPSVVLRGLSEDGNALGAFVVATFGGGATNATLTEKFRVTSGGNVGIGETGPVVGLDIKSGQSTSGSLTYTQRITSLGAYNAYPVAGIAFSNIYASGGSYSALSGISGGKENATDGDYASYLALHTRANGASITEKVRITSAGYVGIGTTSPAGPLHVYQASGGVNCLSLSTSFGSGNTYAINPFISGVSNGGFSIRDVTNGVDRLVVQYSTGYVGIGTTAPQVRAHIVGTEVGLTSEATYGLWVSSASVPTKALILGFYPTADVGVINAVHQGISWKNIALQTNGGNVGIGTTAPTAPLHVVGGGGDSLPGLKVIQTAGASTFNWIASFINSGATAGRNTVLFFGQDASAKNAGYIGFNHTSVGSNSNFLTLGLHSQDNVLNIFGSGNTNLGSTTDQGYKLYVGGTLGVSGNVNIGNAAVLKLGDADAQGFGVSRTRLQLAPPQHTGGEWDFITYDDASYAYLRLGYAGANSFQFQNGGNLVIAGTFSASNFSGSHSGTSSGTNTGDTATSGKEFVHSGRDFTAGTLITTSITVGSGVAWYCEIKGNTYQGGVPPYDIILQGYIYGGTMYYSGSAAAKTSTAIANIYVFANSGGFLSFWFARQGYWQGFDVRCVVAYPGVQPNTVTSIGDSTLPATRTNEAIVSTVYAISSANIASQSVSYAATAGNASTATNAYGAAFTTAGNSSWGGRVQLGGNGGSSGNALIATVQSTNGNLHIDPGPGNLIYLGYYNANTIMLNGGTHSISANGSQYTGNSATATTATTATNLSGGTVYATLVQSSGVLNLGSASATPYSNPTGQSCGITFGGWESSSCRQYGVFTEYENVGGNYAKLAINWHTGIRIGAYSSYGGTRFFNNAWGSGGTGVQTMSINDGDNHVRVVNNLYVGGTVTGSNLSGTNTGDQTNISGNAASASGLHGPGATALYSTDAGLGYGTALQVREVNIAGAQGSNMIYAPRLGWHWGGIVASSIAMEASGRIGIFNNPGTSYEAFVCAALTASTGTFGGAITATGNITAYYSDDRLKTRLGYIENALDKISTLDTFYYEANALAQSLGYTPKREVGLSAQQVQQVMDEVVSPAPIDARYLTLQYERLVTLAFAGIKELRKEVQELRGYMQ